MNVRNITIADKDEWARMRKLLWPGSPEEHYKVIDQFFSDGTKYVTEVCVIDAGDGKLVGFIEINLRSLVDASDADNIPYVEGWFVDKEFRGKGFGKLLMEAAEKWSLDNGFCELVSDAELDNVNGIAAHKALGFKEVERTILFVKKLR